jgi:hypothetical protein
MTHAIEEDNCMVALHASAPPPSHTDALAGREVSGFLTIPHTTSSSIHRLS